MTKEAKIDMYDEKEEKWNVLTHAFGLFVGVVLLPLLVKKSTEYQGWSSASFIIYGISMIVLFAASTLYHREKDTQKRMRLKIFDHAAIYALIAGTYTPFCLVALHKTHLGWNMFVITWTLAFLGIVFKLFFTGKFKLISTLLYVAMGWQVIFFIKPLKENLSNAGLNLLFYGGLFYTVGAVLYSIKKIPYNHAIFHVFVLLDSWSHFLVICYHL